MVSPCQRSQMNASRHFVITLNKRNRHQLSHSALPHTCQAPRRLNTVPFGGVEDFETVIRTEYRNVTGSRPERGFSSIYAKRDAPSSRHDLWSCVLQSDVERSDGEASGLTAALREGLLAEAGLPHRSLGQGGLSV